MSDEFPTPPKDGTMMLPDTFARLKILDGLKEDKIHLRQDGMSLGRFLNDSVPPELNSNVYFLTETGWQIAATVLQPEKETLLWTDQMTRPDDASSTFIVKKRYATGFSSSSSIYYEETEIHQKNPIPGNPSYRISARQYIRLGETANTRFHAKIIEKMGKK